MSAFFADTSALVKRYVAELGSAWVRGWIRPGQGHIIAISEIAIVDLSSALARRQRQGSLPVADALSQRNNFLVHVQQEYLVVSLNRSLLSEAARLVSAFPLRTLDAIQLACALEGAQGLNLPVTFVSADRNLLTAAAAVGFATDDPNAHP